MILRASKLGRGLVFDKPAAPARESAIPRWRCGLVGRRRTQSGRRPQHSQTCRVVLHRENAPLRGSFKLTALCIICNFAPLRRWFEVVLHHASYTTPLCRSAEPCATNRVLPHFSRG